MFERIFRRGYRWARRQLQCRICKKPIQPGERIQCWALIGYRAGRLIWLCEECGELLAVERDEQLGEVPRLGASKSNKEWADKLGA